MYVVYILLSKKDGRTYTGFTNNFEDRFQEHNSGTVRSTKYRRPLTVLHLEKFKTTKEAKKRERWWKSGAGRNKMKALFSDRKPLERGSPR